AREAFRRGRAAYRAGRWQEALVLYRLGYVLDPEVPGFLRELGATYDKLGQSDRKQAFYQAYLRALPFGRGARDIRRALQKDRGALGRLSIASSLPCDELWLNRQLVPGGKVTGLIVPPGSYRALCVSYKYEIAYFEYAEVVAEQTAELQFRWAVVVNQLEDPFGRITIENPRVPGVMMDLGISSPEVGVIVPEDGRALRMILRDDRRTRREERSITLQSGQRHVIKW
ncbi:MAG: hypothetical protein AAGC55_28910, partial [Myxococcota bacterium]